jgi:glutathione S-transferase
LQYYIGGLTHPLELTTGPYFAGERFTMADAVFAPVFRYFDVFEQSEDFGFFARTLAWRGD